MHTLICTFNMGGAAFANQDQISSCLPISNLQPELVVIGLQEAHGKATSQLLKYLIMHEYYLVCEHVLLGQRLLVSCRGLDAKHKIRNCRLLGQRECKNGGVASRSKGGIAVYLEYGSAKISFVAAHLASHRRYLHSRNLDASEILKLVPPVQDDDHHLFVFGDLNYRIGSLKGAKDVDRDENNILLCEPRTDEDDKAQREFNRQEDHTAEERKTIEDWISAGAFQEIMARCQLRQQLNEAEASPSAPFAGFQEAVDVSYPPTFKLGASEGTYDAKRLPSYCDRILWKSTSVRQVFVSSVMQVTSSDHKPVVSLFDIDV